ncbi:sensor histidine kinase [Kribbella sancticallisti]|uniref:sensor histidine kinase n=1 Tax=Kribbella sancticallisti TaxID=460087 RepID=UPI0031D04AEF
MTQADRLVDRVAAISRRITDAPEWPAVAAIGLGTAAVIETVVQLEGTGANLSIALLLALASTAPLAVSREHLVLGAGVVAVANLLSVLAYQWTTVAGLVALLAVIYLVGAVIVTGRRQRLKEAAARDESSRLVADTLLEHALRGERARIARELHDVVAHHISMIAVQAETARLTTPGLPAEGADRLVAIGDTARAALTEMRRLLGVLREDAGTEPTRKPQPSLQQLVDLVDDARDSTGASTRLIVHGLVGPLDPGLELIAFRIIQEALTNTRRHAPGAAVDVELEYGADELRLRVRDNGPGRSTGKSGEGHGLLGMQERAATVGGWLRTGPAPVNGFLVEATLPIPRPVSSETVAR